MAWRRSRLLSSFLAVSLLAACGSPAATPTAAPTELAAAPTLIPTNTPAPTSTPAPTETPAPTSTPAPTETPAPTSTPEAQVEGTLSLPRGELSGRPAAVMLDNHPNAYPQSGLDRSPLVFEALAEFGITRYMALYRPEDADRLAAVGPVRSARPYFVEWAKGFRAIYSHAGGSPEGLLLAETSVEIVNMDALRGNAANDFYRSAKAAPHNLYTDGATLFAFGERIGSPASSADLSEIGFLYKSESLPADGPAANRLAYYFIYAEQFVAWEYDPATNDYLRFRSTRPYIDEQTGAQLRFKNVLVMEVPERPIPNDPKGRIEQQVLGSGPARLFLDGTVQEITWRKDAGFAQLRFFTADGAEIQLNPGATWIAAIPSLDNLTVE